MSRFCTGCGCELKATAKFCSKCGKVVAGVDATSTSLISNENNGLFTGKNKSGIKKFIPFVVIALLIISCGVLYFIFANAEPSEEDINKSMSPMIQHEELKIKDVDIKEVSVNEDKTFADVRCTLTLENEEVRKVQSYDIKYFRIGDGTWIMDRFDQYKREEWTAEPLKGVGVKTIKNSLSGQKIKIDGNNITVWSENVSDLVVDKQDTMLKECKDEVSFTYKINSKYASSAQKAKAIYVFDPDRGMWSLFNLIHDETSKVSLKEGFEFKRSNEEVKKDIYKSPIYWKTRYGTQTVATNDNTMKNLKIEPEAFHWKTGLVTQKVAFDLVKRVATVHVDADIVYEYGSSGWQIKNIQYKPKVESVALKGKWMGHYSTWSGKPSLALTVNTQDANGMLTAIFRFGPSANVPNYEPGSYSMVGGVEKESLTVTLRGNNWISKPRGFRMVDLDGVLLIDEEKIADDDRSFSVSKTR